MKQSTETIQDQFGIAYTDDIVKAEIEYRQFFTVLFNTCCHRDISSVVTKHQNVSR